MAYVPSSVAVRVNLGFGTHDVNATSLAVRSPVGEVADVTGPWDGKQGERTLIATEDVLQAGVITIEAIRGKDEVSWAPYVSSGGTLSVSSTADIGLPSQTWNVVLESVDESLGVGDLARQTLVFKLGKY